MRRRRFSVFAAFTGRRSGDFTCNKCVAARTSGRGIVVLMRFLDANRCPPRLKTLYNPPIAFSGHQGIANEQNSFRHSPDSDGLQRVGAAEGGTGRLLAGRPAILPGADTGRPPDHSGLPEAEPCAHQQGLPADAGQPRAVEGWSNTGADRIRTEAADSCLTRFLPQKSRRNLRKPDCYANRYALRSKTL